MKTGIIFLVLVSFGLVGCQQQDTPAPAPAPTAVKPTDGGANPIANGEELTVNPNGKAVQPGSALGNR